MTISINGIYVKIAQMSVKGGSVKGGQDSSIKGAREPTSVQETVNLNTGLKLDKYDHRDQVKVYGAPHIPSKDEHPEADLREYIINIYTQGKMNSCAANVICAAYELLRNKQIKQAGGYSYSYSVGVSRLFVYYNSRVYENDTENDGGATFRDTLKTMILDGVCKENLWPYEVSKVSVKPTSECYADARGNNIRKFESLQQNLDQLRACLKDGYPFAFGFRIYKSFLATAEAGMMPAPTDEEIQTTPDPLMHGVLAVGYNDHTERITVLASWGSSYGDRGYFYMPYKSITDPRIAFNFWKLSEVSQQEEVHVVIHTLP